MWSRQDLREGAASLLELEAISEERLFAFMSAQLWLSEASRADDGLTWELVRAFLFLVSTIAESGGEMVSWDNSTELGRKALSVLRDALESARRGGQGLSPLPPAEDWQNYDPFEDR